MDRRSGGALSALGRHRTLTWELARRDVLGRYRGASFGLLWSLISPFLLLMIYTFAFGTVMKGRWPQVEAGHTQQTEVESALSLLGGGGQVSFLLNKVPVGSSEHFGSYSYYDNESKT